MCIRDRTDTDIVAYFTSRAKNAVVVCAQTINILIVNQSITDMCASLLTLLTAVVEVDGTRMSRTSAWDQFVCRVWLTRILLFSFLVTSTYGILTTALERYVAVVYPIWYKVRTQQIAN